MKILHYIFFLSLICFGCATECHYVGREFNETWEITRQLNVGNYTTNCIETEVQLNGDYTDKCEWFSE